MFLLCAGFECWTTGHSIYIKSHSASVAVSVWDVPILAFDKIPRCITQGDPWKMPPEAFSEWMLYCRALDQRRCQNWPMWLHRLEREMSLLWLWLWKKSVLENSKRLKREADYVKSLQEQPRNTSLLLALANASQAEFSVKTDQDWCPPQSIWHIFTPDINWHVLFLPEQARAMNSWFSIVCPVCCRHPNASRCVLLAPSQAIRDVLGKVVSQVDEARVD